MLALNKTCLGSHVIYSILIIKVCTNIYLTKANFRKSFNTEFSVDFLNKIQPSNWRKNMSFQQSFQMKYMLEKNINDNEDKRMAK